MPVDESALRVAFSDFVQTSVEECEPAEICQLVGAHTVAALHADVAVVALLEDSGLQVVACHPEDPGLSAHSGPGPPAVATGAMVSSTDLEGESRWPGFCRAALACELKAVACLPLVSDSRMLGVVSVYWRQAHPLRQDEREAAQLLADLAAGRLQTLRRLHEVQEEKSQLQYALGSRVMIEQAKGMLAERHNMSPQEAFDLLRRHARPNYRRIHDVAREVIAGELEL